MVIIPVIANYQTRSRKSAMIAGQRPMFENIDSAKPEKHWLLRASLKAIGSGFACFLLAFFLSLLITIPWSKHYWAGEAQAVLGGFALSFYFGLASGITAAVYILRRTIRSRR
jgi:hypothetical protein